MSKTVHVRRPPPGRRKATQMLVFAGHTLRLINGQRECVRCGEISERIDHFRRTYCDARDAPI